MASIIWFIVGLFLGWFFLPAPLWAVNLVNKLVDKVPFLKAFLKK